MCLHFSCSHPSCVCVRTHSCTAYMGCSEHSPSRSRCGGQVGLGAGIGPWGPVASLPALPCAPWGVCLRGECAVKLAGRPGLGDPSRELLGFVAAVRLNAGVSWTPRWLWGSLAFWWTLSRGDVGCREHGAPPCGGHTCLCRQGNGSWAGAGRWLCAGARIPESSPSLCVTPLAEVDELRL